MLWPFTRRVYLDNASAQFPTQQAVRAFLKALAHSANPSSHHREGVAANTLLEIARDSVAEVVQSKPHAVLFTSNATEANSLAILGVVRPLLKIKTPEEIEVLYMDGSHSSLMEPLKYLESLGVVIKKISTNGGTVLLPEIEELVTPATALVVLERVNSETGALFDTRSIARLCHSKAPSVVVHVDACQSPLFEDISYTRLGADTLSIDAQKIGGVRGAGALIKNTIQTFEPLMYGGGQEMTLRPGTQATALIASFAEALSAAKKNHKKFEKKAQRLREQFIRKLQKLSSDIKINEGRENAPHIINISVPMIDTEYALYQLDVLGVALSTKSACDEGENASRAVLAYTQDANRATHTLRISMSQTTTSGDLSYVVQCIQKVIKMQHNRGSKE